MKKLNVMLHTEIIECLKELDDETLSKIMRMIFDWYDEKKVEPQTQLEKFAWKLIYPKLESNKESYLQLVERNKENGKKGGRPKTSDNPNNPSGFVGNPEKHNYNYNYINNTSKDVLLIAENDETKQETLEGVSVLKEETNVSKGLETLEKTFPQRKRDIGIDEINLWNSLTQGQKANLIKKAVLYVRNETNNEDGKFIKKMSKWLKEEIDKGIEEELIPKKKTSTKQTFKYVDGTIYSILQDKLGSTKEADYVWHSLNVYGLSKEELFEVVKTESKETLLEIIKK